LRRPEERSKKKNVEKGGIRAVIFKRKWVVGTQPFFTVSAGKNLQGSPPFNTFCLQSNANYLGRIH
jgi:hypothetical protein